MGIVETISGYISSLAADSGAFSGWNWFVSSATIILGILGILFLFVVGNLFIFGQIWLLAKLAGFIGDRLKEMKISGNIKKEVFG